MTDALIQTIYKKIKGRIEWIVVEAEQDPAKANPLKYAKIGYKYLSKVLEND